MDIFVLIGIFKLLLGGVLLSNVGAVAPFPTS